jgi:16S rRNA (guanine966-N2)-methyltransferase
LRIISGDLKGKKLRSIKGTKTRPTSDRLRESIFNIIAFNVEDTCILDLFAGTGAFAIEALSRGSKFAVFIDISKNAISSITENIKSCSLGNRAKVIKWDINKNLNCVEHSNPAFDLVFMDPPYNQNFLKPTLLSLHLSCCMKKGCLIIIEHSLREPIPKEPAVFEIADQRKYGKTLVSFLNYVI